MPLNKETKPTMILLNSLVGDTRVQNFPIDICLKGNPKARLADEFDDFEIAVKYSRELTGRELSLEALLLKIES